MIEKYESHRIREDIRRVLMEVWDPIGVKSEPNAKGEYDSYVGGVYTLLTDKATESQITEHLLCIVHERMELKAATLDAMSDAVKALRLIPLPAES